MYEKNQQVEVGGEQNCYLFMKSLIYEIQNISNLDYVDGDISLLNTNYSVFLQDRVGVKYGSKRKISKLLRKKRPFLFFSYTHVCQPTKHKRNNNWGRQTEYDGPGRIHLPELRTIQQVSEFCLNLIKRFVRVELGLRPRLIQIISL